MTDTQIWHHAIYGNQRLINSIIVTNKILLRIITANLVANRVELAERNAYLAFFLHIHLFVASLFAIVLFKSMISSKKMI